MTRKAPGICLFSLVISNIIIGVEFLQEFFCRLRVEETDVTIITGIDLNIRRWMNEAPRRRAAGYLKTGLTVYFYAKLCILFQSLGHEHIS
jgi:hypothetical protein